MNKAAILSSNPDILNLCKIALDDAGVQSIILDFSCKEKEELSARAETFSPSLIFVSFESLDFFKTKIYPILKNKSEFLYGILLPAQELEINGDFMTKNFLSGYVRPPLSISKISSAARQIFSHIKLEKEKEEKIKAQNLKEKNIRGFLSLLGSESKLKAEELEKYLKDKNFDVFQLKDITGKDEIEIGTALASYLNMPFLKMINPDDLLQDILPPKFSKNNLVAAVKGEAENYLVFPYHFDQNLLSALASLNLKNFKYAVASPKTLKSILHLAEENKNSNLSLLEEKGDYLDLSANVLKNKIEDAPVIYITNKIVENAIASKASDFHLEPKETFYSLRFRIDGDLVEFTKLKRETGNMVITRLKALSSMDITERRRPQDGAFSVKKDGKKYTLRLATTSTGNGESVVARIIDNEAKPRPLSELGMYPNQEAVMVELSKCSQGIILIAAPTGSGKTTTIYSFISSLDLDRKSLITVEDPIEYKIPKANQQQINEKAGVTFSQLLKSSVRQDPDILFLGEVRDEESARTAFDFSSTGHVTISTIHTANATSAIFRLERFFITRQQMAETVLALISQRLIKMLCPHCKIKTETSKQEYETALKFSVELPKEIYRANGCPKCLKSGYSGRKAVYEILRFTPEISDMVARGAKVSEIRGYLFSKKETLMPQAALMRLSEGIFDFKQIYERILAEELKNLQEIRPSSASKLPQAESHALKKIDSPEAQEDETGSENKKKILVVDDDRDLLGLISKILASAGYDTETAEDGLDAIVKISRNKYDLVVSDLDMPNLNGLKLVETVKNKNLGARIIMLTASSDDTAEERALEFGAYDYIRKPFKKDVLLLRIKKALVS